MCILYDHSFSGLKTKCCSSAIVLGSQRMAPHSFSTLGEGRLCSCVVCLSLIRLGRTLTSSDVSSRFKQIWTEKLQLLAIEAQDASVLDFTGSSPPQGDPAAPGTGITPGKGAKEDRKARKGEHHSKEERKDRSPRKKEKKRRETEREEEPAASHRGYSPVSDKPKKEKHRKRSKDSRSRSRGRDRKRVSRGAEEPRPEEKREETPDREERERETPKEPAVAVKEELDSEEEEEEESEEEEQEENFRAPTPLAALGPRPPPGPPGACHIPRPPAIPAWDRPPLQRWQAPFPVASDRPRSPKRRREKGAKKKRRQRDIKRAGGLAAWHASKKGGGWS